MHHAHSKKRSQGFVLPAVIMIGFAIMILGITNLGVIASSSTNLNDQYYQQLAKEAADAGATVASGCVKDNRIWSGDLTMQQDCDTSLPDGIETVAAQDNWSSSYKVSSPTSDASSLSFISVGTVTFEGSDKTYTADTKTTFKKSETPSGALSKPIADISLGTNSMCAVAENKAYCWGNNTDGQLGDASTTSRSSPVAVSVKTTKTDAVVGVCGSFMVGSDCFLDNWTVRPQPEIPPSALAGKSVTKVARGVGGHSCAIADGKAYCWGDNDNGQLGNRTKVDSSWVPVAVYDEAVARPAVAGQCQIGSGTSSCPFGWWKVAPIDAVPASPIANKEIKDIVVGADYTCALTTEGKVSCWGANSRGQLGTNSRAGLSAPTPVFTNDATPFIPGNCIGWSSGIRSCLGVWSPKYIEPQPATPMFGKTIKSISVGTYHTCAFDNANIAYCWGKNEGGQLGNNASAPPSTGSAAANAEAWSLPDGCSGTYGVAPQRGPDPSESDELQPVIVDASGSYTKQYWWGGTATVPASPLNGKTITNIQTVGSYTNILADGKVYWFGGPDASPVGQTGTKQETCQNRTPNGCQNNVPQGANYCSSVVTERETVRTHWKIWRYDMQSRAAGPMYVDKNFFGFTVPNTNILKTKSLDQTSGAIFGDENCGFFAYLFSLGGCNNGATQGTFCALTNDAIKELYCDGPLTYSPYTGSLGDGVTTSPRNLSGPVAVKTSGALAGKSITTLKSNARGDYSCVIADNAVYCWGNNYAGRLGTGDTVNRFEPTSPKLDGGSPIGNPGGGATAIYSDPITF